jgi:general secretion pathway protein D
LATFFGPIGAGLTAFAFESEKFLAMINILAAENRVNIISSPHVMTSENKKAVINVSTSVPIITGQQTSTVSSPGTIAGSTTTSITQGGVNQSVEYRDAGVVLTVTPRIGERGTVALDVKQEVNSVGPGIAPTFSPSFIKREAETSVVLLNNQTLVLGGLIQDTVTKNEQGIPYLKRIPVLGYLFGFKERKIEKTELLLLITPRVIGTAVDAARITNEMRRTTPELNEAIRSAPRSPYVVPPPGGPVPAPMAPGAPSSTISPVPPAGSPASVPGPGGFPPMPVAPQRTPVAPPPKPSSAIPTPTPAVAAPMAPAPAITPTALSPPPTSPVDQQPPPGRPTGSSIREILRGGQTTVDPQTPVSPSGSPAPRN